LIGDVTIRSEPETGNASAKTESCGSNDPCVFSNVYGSSCFETDSSFFQTLSASLFWRHSENLNLMARPFGMSANNKNSPLLSAVSPMQPSHLHAQPIHTNPADLNWIGLYYKLHLWFIKICLSHTQHSITFCFAINCTQKFYTSSANENQNSNTTTTLCRSTSQTWVTSHISDSNVDSAVSRYVRISSLLPCVRLTSHDQNISAIDALQETHLHKAPSDWKYWIPQPVILWLKC
jgi:hypothetical protein